MKVRVVLSIEVDPQAWRDEYGEPNLSDDEIRQAVRDSVVSAAITPGVVVPQGIITDVEDKS